LLKPNTNVESQISGGGQERGFRSGTENLIGVAGLGAAITYAKKQLSNGIWEEIGELRDYLESEVANISQSTKLVGKDSSRLPNTSFFVTPGWKGDTQVIQMDLNGFAISSGSACSSGKVKKSNVLEVFGYDSSYKDCGIRVSIGYSTTKEQIQKFVKAWSLCRNDVREMSVH
jgi:cysteine desulfurase